MSHAGDLLPLTMSLVKIQQSPYIDISNSITVCHHKGIISNVFLHRFHWPPSHSVRPSFSQRHLKILLFMILVISNAILATQANSKIIIHSFIIQEILLNYVAAIAQKHNKVQESVVGIGLYNVPENRTPAHIN